MKKYLALLLSLIISTTCFCNDYQDAWKLIQSRKYNEAIISLNKAIQNPATAIDAYCTLLFLHTYRGKESELPGFLDVISKSSDKNPYVYALWFNGAVLGDYSKKLAHQTKWLNQIQKDNSFNSSIKAASSYVKGMHYVFSNDYNKAVTEWKGIGALEQWQYAGPFDNLSGSGFNVYTAPLKEPDSSAVFKGFYDTDVKWHTPAESTFEGWIMFHRITQRNSAVEFAQTFVYVPEDVKAIINLGVNGSIKAWVNDGLVLSERKERTTELDYYKNYCNLKKGFNRILLQVGYTNTSTPNFILRLTDDKQQPINGLTSTSLNQSYTKSENNSSTASLKHFAEMYFEKKLEDEPANLVNYILLSQAYLRNSRISEARHVIEKALKLAPDNALLKFELMQVLIKAGNRTQLVQEADWLKENDPESAMNFQMKIELLMSEEKYAEAGEEIDKMVGIYGETEESLAMKATVMGKTEKLEDLIKLVEATYKKYPTNAKFVTMMFMVKKLIKKDIKAAIAVYEKYLEENFNSAILEALSNEYKEMGQDENYLKKVKVAMNMTPQDPTFELILSKYYFEKQEFSKALVYANNAINFAPYEGSNWHYLASIHEQMNHKDEAIKFYQKAVYYDRTDYDARKKINTLLNKQEPYKSLPETDAYALIKKTPINSDHDYSFLLDEKATIIYDKGASEEYITYVVKINTEKGIDTWKEINLAGGNSQSLLVEKCEVVKVSGSKVSAERDGYSVVFTGLVVGDAIYVKYRLQNYSYGRLGREFWEKFLFNSFVNSHTAAYTLITPKDFYFNSKLSNVNITPETKIIGDYKMHRWELKPPSVVKSEPMMPAVNDVAQRVDITTVKTWDEIATWYADLAYQNIEEDYDLVELYKQIFEGSIGLTEYQKAKKIYSFITRNIRYSSVAFRQNGYVPQNISTIINTRLGDCKDLASLYVALAEKAGLKAQLVLIDTRDNGTHDMQLPSMEFNHCITLVFIDGKEYFVELTDNNLPFGSLPTNLNGALSLIIPSDGQRSTTGLKPLNSRTRTTDKLSRKITATLVGKDIRLAIDCKRQGALVSEWRHEYGTLSVEKQKENFEQMLSNGNKNPVKLESLSFDGLSGEGDSLLIKYTYVLKNEVIDADPMRMIKIPFIDIIATLESLSSDTRTYPFEYWNYETTDNYDTDLIVNIPAGKKVGKLPAGANLSFGKSTYNLSFVQTGNQIKIKRKAFMNRENVDVADYPKFKAFFNDIVEA